MQESRATLLVLFAAFVSGFSIFLNKIAVTELNPLIFTALKNTVVAVFLISIILLFKRLGALKKLSRKNWLQLATIGLVGGSVPFLLYFYALKLTSAVNAGFLHKTMFLFASLFAFVFLKEKISARFAAAAALLLAGNFLLFSQFSGFGLPELLVIAAVLLWALENIIAKNAMQKGLDGTTVAFGRMFFGSAFMLAFLLATSQFSLSSQQFGMQLNAVLLTSVPLLLYVLLYFNALQGMRVQKATALLMLGQPITALLSMLFLSQRLSFNDALGISLAFAGALLLIGATFFPGFLQYRKLNIIKVH